MTRFGVDLSDYDRDRGPVDVAAMKADGITVLSHKSTEGTSVRHKYLGATLNAAKAAGIPYLGAYHVVRSPANAAAEVDYCLAYVTAQVPWWRDYQRWFWQVDLEKWPYDSVAFSEGEAFADIIQARTGRPAILYASRGQYGDTMSSSSHPLWNANYGTNPVLPYRQAYTARGGDSGIGWTKYSGRVPLLWQFGSRTKIGSQPGCDADAIRDETAWQALFGEDDTMDQAQFTVLMDGWVKERAGNYRVQQLLVNQALYTSGSPPATVQDALKAAYTLPPQITALRADVAAALGRDPVDEQAIVDGVLAGLAGRSVDSLDEALSAVLTPEQRAALGARWSSAPLTS